MGPNALPQLAGFLADLIFVGCGFAALLYAVWLQAKRPSVAGMGRLSLVVSFGAVVTLFALGQTQGAPVSLPMFFLFVLMAIFLLLEFLFQMSALGLLVSLIGLGVGALHYLPVLAWPAIAPASPVVAYWWVLRDLAVTTGAAVLTLGLGTAGLLNAYGDRRPSPLVHPNDLRDVAALLARGAVPCFFFGAVAAGVAVARHPQPGWADWGAVGLLGLILVASIAWWTVAEGRRFRGARGWILLAVNVALLAAYAARAHWGAG